jgi:release factor glutamine methyltransferase
MTATRVTATVGDALRRATERLRATETPTPRLDAELLVGHVAGRDRSWVLAHPEAALDVHAAEALDAAVSRRADGEPIAYIRGYKEWRSLRVRTDRRALIPRPETELLADAALAEVGTRLASSPAGVVLWDVGTGTGAISLVVARETAAARAGGRLRLVASDVSPHALRLAAENLEGHGLADAVTLVEADLLERAGHLHPRPDVVVANLPYVPSSDVEHGTGSMRHEPHLALDGGPDGLDVIRRLMDGVGGRVAPRAALLLEIGAGQADVVRELAPSDASVDLVRDLAGIDRVIRIGLAA